MKSKTENENKYDRLLAAIFRVKWKASLTEVPFTKDEVINAAGKLGLGGMRGAKPFASDSRARARNKEK